MKIHIDELVLNDFTDINAREAKSTIVQGLSDSTQTDYSSHLDKATTQQIAESVHKTLSKAGNL